MTQWLSLSRAARLLGVSRSVLQKRIRDGELEANDGAVSTDELMRLYPDVRPEDSGALERVTRIREEAFGRRVREYALPTQEALAQRVFAQSQEVADLRRHLERYHALVVALQAEVEARLGDPPADALRSLRERIDAGLAAVLSTEPADPLTVLDDMLKVVSAHVTLRPSGREFFVDGQDSLLQAALSAGIPLDYGCGNGSCGLCKARIVSGQVVRTGPADYRLSEAEKARGYALLCAHTAGCGELVIETHEAGSPDEVPAQQITATVRYLTPLAPDTLLLHLQTPRSARLRFLAGQGATLGAALSGTDVHGRYPIASCPCDDRNLHFHVPRDAADPFASLLFGGHLRAGDQVTVWGPDGRFVLGAEGRPLIFIACDTGFAPVKSLIEHAVAGDAAESITLHWLATRSDGHYLENHCRAWSAALDGFSYHGHLAPSASAGGERIGADVAASPLASRSDFYVAGPAAFVASVTAALAAGGIAADRIAAESL